MDNSPKISTKRPMLVRLGLWGLKTRQSALVFMWLCIIIAIGALLAKFWIGSAMLLAAFWYWYAVKWVDKNEGWK